MEQAKKENPDSSQSGQGESKPVADKPASKGYFWFIAQGNILKGPYSTTELKKLVDKKEISERFFAWRDGYREWRPLYGIEELKNEKIGENLAYPTVPTPGHAAESVVLNNPIRQRNAPIYKVRFNRSRWSDLKKSEVVGLFLVSLGFTLCFLMLSIHVFEKEWNKVWGKRSAGMLFPLGTASDTVPLYLLNPMLSAPGLKVQEHHWVAVEHEGNMEKYHPMEIDSFHIDSNLAPESMQNLNWDDSNTYTRRMIVRGYIDLKDSHTLLVESPGLPYQPVIEPGLPERIAHP